MTTTGWRILLLALMVAATGVLAGCGAGGGGGGASSLTITLSGLSSTTIQPGQTITGSVKLSASAAGLNDVQVTIKTDAAELTGTAGRTDALGNAIFNLSAATNASLSKTVNVWAELDGVRSSNTLQVSLNSVAESVTFNLSVTDAIPVERTVDAGSGAAVQGVVLTGSSIEFKGPGGVILPNPPPVTISIDRIVNWMAGDLVTVNGVAFAATSPTQSTTLALSNVTNKADIPIIVEILLPPAPAAGSSTPNTYAIYWRATATYNGVTYTRTAVTSVNGKTTGK